MKCFHIIPQTTLTRENSYITAVQFAIAIVKYICLVISLATGGIINFDFVMRSVNEV